MQSGLQLVLVLAFVVAMAFGCDSSDSPSSAPAPTPTASQEHTAAPTPTASQEPTTTATPEPTAAPTNAPAPTPTATPVRLIEFEYAFENDAEGWTAGFADLPMDYDPAIYELDSSHRALPDGLEGSGIYIQGHNRSDDLFMYLKRQVEGLEPSAVYTVSASIDLATNVPLAMVGIGGSPGESVFVKAGASMVEPAAVTGSNNHLRMNIDKGNQSTGGSAMKVVGNVANPDVIGDEYRIKTLASGPEFLNVETDSEGRAWLIVGTDSGFEGLTRLYYDQISFTLTLSD